MVRFYDIEWDREADGEQDTETELPSAVTREVPDDFGIDERGADLLSDEFGFCVFGFRFQRVEPKGTSRKKGGK